MTINASVAGEQLGAARPVGRVHRFGFLLAIGLCASLLIGFVFTYAGLVAHGGAGIKQNDFVTYYSAGHFVATGHGSQIYAKGAFGAYQRALVAPLRMRYGWLPYVYPPFLGILLAPLGALPYAAAWVLWLGINLALTILIVRALGRYLQPGPLATVLLWVASLSFFPVFMAATQGQTSLVILAALVAAFLALRDRRDVLAGPLLAVALIKPQYVAPVVLVLLVRGRWRALVSFGFSAAFLFALPVVLLGSRIDIQYLVALRQASGWHDQFGYQPALNQSVAGFAQLLLPGAVATVATILIGVLAVVALVWISRRADGIELPLALATTLAIALSPHVLIHDLSLLVLPAVVAVAHRTAGPGHLTPLLAGGYIAVLAGLRVVTVLPLQLSVLATAALALWLALAASRGFISSPTIALPEDR